MKAVFLLTLIAIVLFLVWFFDSCRPTPKPVLHMMEDTILHYLDSGLIYECGGAPVSFTISIDGVTMDTIYPEKHNHYVCRGKFGHLGFKVLHRCPDTVMCDPDSARADIKIIPHPFVEKERGRISISGSGITEITGDIDAMGYWPTLSNHWTIPDLW